jgi:hypothetical protein
MEVTDNLTAEVSDAGRKLILLQKGKAIPVTGREGS